MIFISLCFLKPVIVPGYTAVINLLFLLSAPTPNSFRLAYRVPPDILEEEKDLEKAGIQPGPSCSIPNTGSSNTQINC